MNFFDTIISIPTEIQTVYENKEEEQFSLSVPFYEKLD